MKSEIKSPCTRKCQLEEDKEFCKGCYRSLQEIMDWDYLTDVHKYFVLNRCKAEKAREALLQKSQGGSDDTMA